MSVALLDSLKALAKQIEWVRMLKGGYVCLELKRKLA